MVQIQARHAPWQGVGGGEHLVHVCMHACMYVCMIRSKLAMRLGRVWVEVSTWTEELGRRKWGGGSGEEEVGRRKWEGGSGKWE